MSSAVASVPPVRPLSALFRALGDETRLRVVALLAHGELCVCHVESALGLSQPTASRHLGILRAAGIVEAERRGSWVYYRLARQDDAARDRHLRLLVREFGDRDRLAADLVRLRRSKGPDVCR